jgi:hypothetical protein
VSQSKPPGRPVADERHPLSTRTYRVATTAIEQCWQLVSKCLQYRIPGALIYGESRLGKTYAIEYLRMLIHRELPCGFWCKLRMRGREPAHLPAGLTRPGHLPRFRA